MCFVFLFNKYPSFYAKKLSLKKPNLREARNWIAEQQFYREKKLVCRKSILPKKKKNTKFVAIQYKKEQKNMSKAFNCLIEQQPIFDNRLGVSLGEGIVWVCWRER